MCGYGRTLLGVLRDHGGLSGQRSGELGDEGVTLGKASTFERQITMRNVINQRGAVHQHHSVNLSDSASLNALVPSQAAVCIIYASLSATAGRFLNI